MYANKAITRSIIDGIIGDCLALKRYKRSQIATPDSSNRRQTGAVFVARTKADLGVAHGLVVTSREAIFDQVGATHWTPNVFRYGTYAARGPEFKVFKGHSEDNLKAVTTFVVDIDYPGETRPDYADFDAGCFTVTLNKHLLEPSMILGTPHGYQAYYILRTPVWMRVNAAGQMPALVAAKRVSRAIREEVAKKNPNTDTGANDFGFFRMPSTTNILDVNDDARADFGELMRWSMARGTAELRARRLPQHVTDQIHTPWFRALSDATVPCAHGAGYGRNNVLLTLCLALYSSGKSEAECLNFADEWDSRQPDPLRFCEVQAIVRSAYSGRYQGASINYVAELCKRYAPSVAPQKSGHAWVHVAKPRAERKYSHLGEWVQDVVRLVQQATDLVDGYARFTVAELQTQLGISRESIQRVLDLLHKSATFAVRRVRGRNGGLYIATAQMLTAYVQGVKAARAIRDEHVAVQKLVLGSVVSLGGEKLWNLESPPYQRL